MSISLPAYAKINLSLRVLGRRADGYHEIRTVFQSVTLHDRLTFHNERDDHFEVVCTDPSVPTDGRNLVSKAASALRERFGVRRGARVELDKVIPAGGGLGGGSSDAASALVGLATLWGLKVRGTELREIGARLGADVPFFLTGGTALGTGTGAVVTPLEDAPVMHLVIVTPPVHVSTAEAYESLNAPALTKAGGAASLSVSHAGSDFPAFPQWEPVNDFERAVLGAHPEVARARAALDAAGARIVMLSGSGSSVYGAFGDEACARSARDSIVAAHGWKVFRCATLPRGEYRGAFGPCAELLR